MNTTIEKKTLIGLFLVLAFFVIGVIVVGNRNLWFESKVGFVTYLQSAESLRVGTVVTMKGIRVGEVKEIKIDENNQVEVQFSIKKSYANKIHEDAVAKIRRTFVIGEKQIEVQLGTLEKPLLKVGGLMASEEGTELLDLLSGSSISTMAAKLDKIATSLDLLLKKVKPEDLAKTYDLIYPTVKNVHDLTVELKPFLREGSKAFHDVNRDLVSSNLLVDSVKKANKIMTPLAANDETIARVMNSVDELTRELAKSPQFSKQMVTALDELVTTLKAVQKTWILSGKVEEVKKSK